jgi:hypothetical protein
MQKTGAGLNSSTTMHWDAAKDGYCKVPWQNPTMHCIVTIYGKIILNIIYIFNIYLIYYIYIYYIIYIFN